MSNNLYDIISKTEIYSGKVLHQGHTAEQIQVWIFTLRHLMANFMEGPYVPCYRPAVFGKKSTAPLCNLGYKCFRIRLYVMLMNMNMLLYSNTVTPELYSNYYMKGVCGCSFRHDEEELVAIDEEIKEDIKTGKITDTIAENLYKLFNVTLTVDESKTHNSFACDIMQKCVGPLDFPHFVMNEIYIFHAPVANDIMTEEEAVEGLKRLKMIKPRGSRWVEMLDAKDTQMSETTKRIVTQPAYVSKESFPELPMDRKASSSRRAIPPSSANKHPSNLSSCEAYNTMISSTEYFPILPDPQPVTIPKPRSKPAQKDNTSNTSSNKSGTRKTTASQSKTYRSIAHNSSNNQFSPTPKMEVRSESVHRSAPSANSVRRVTSPKPIRAESAHVEAIRLEPIRPEPVRYVNKNPTVELVPISDDAIRFF